MGKENLLFLLQVFLSFPFLLIFQHLCYPADVTMEEPVEDGAYHDVGFEEHGCAPVPSFSKPDAGLLADMLAEQATRRTVGPPFESDSFTAPVIGINPISIPGISSLPRSDGLAGPATGTDTLMTPSIPRIPEDDGPTGPAVVPDATTVSGTD
ncbi:uncharacterized protein LOC109827303, partial [Asparagus officinalis]|uniref:uncharacterized protein LOC109827303 n=1 Tax=Asparagus officinalis TaxID=4686 RepID=UPI00098E5A6A